MVVVKATYTLNAVDTQSSLHDMQLPLLEADIFGADPATNAPVLENDFAHFKPKCDILLRAKAYAPNQNPVRRVDVGAMVGQWRKLFTVVGDRYWQKGMAGVHAGEPALFLSQEISYDNAFGGIDADPERPDVVETLLTNPCGTGYCPSGRNIDGMKMPNTEQNTVPIVHPDGRYVPMAWGPIGRNWYPRYSHAGTYDKKWMEERLPFLPDDFDELYYQAAPPDQQIPYPQGGESIVLLNMTSSGRLQTELPKESIFVSLMRKNGEHSDAQAHLDTILIEPDDNRLSLTWRARFALVRDLFELKQIIVETGASRTAGKLRARMTDKTYYKNLDEAVKEKGGK